MTENFVIAAFHKMGEDPQTVRLMRNKYTGEPAGYCFVNFASDVISIQFYLIILTLAVIYGHLITGLVTKAHIGRRTCNLISSIDKSVECLVICRQKFEIFYTKTVVETVLSKKF